MVSILIISHNESLIIQLLYFFSCSNKETTENHILIYISIIFSIMDIFDKKTDMSAAWSLQCLR